MPAIPVDEHLLDSSRAPQTRPREDTKPCVRINALCIGQWGRGLAWIVCLSCVLFAVPLAIAVENDLWVDKPAEAHQNKNAAETAAPVRYGSGSGSGAGRLELKLLAPAESCCENCTKSCTTEAGECNVEPWKIINNAPLRILGDVTLKDSPDKALNKLDLNCTLRAYCADKVVFEQVKSCIDTQEHISHNLYLEVPFEIPYACSKGKPTDQKFRVSILISHAGNSTASASGSVASLGVSLMLQIETSLITWLFVGTSFVSLITGLFVFYFYIRYPDLQIFPSNLILWRTLMDFLFAICMFLFNFVDLQNPKDHTPFMTCKDSPWLAALTQFTMLSSLCWWVSLSLNVFFSIRDPFTKPRSRQPTFYVFSFCVPLLSAIYIGFDQNSYSYRADFHMCWFVKEKSFNFRNIGLFIAPMGLIVATSMAILFWIWLWSPSRRALVEKRKDIINETQTFVFAFLVMVLLLAVTWIGMFFDPSSNILKEAGGDNGADEQLYKDILNSQTLQWVWPKWLFALSAGLTGLVDGVTWLRLKWPKLGESRSLERQRSLTFNVESSSSREPSGSLTMETRWSNTKDEALLRNRQSSLMTDNDVQEEEDISQLVRVDFIKNVTSGMWKVLMDKKVNPGGQTRDHALLAQETYSRTLQVQQETGSRGQKENKLFEKKKFTQYEFTEYAPKVFTELRQLFSGVYSKEGDRSYLSSFSKNENPSSQDIIQMSNNFSEGKSGAFFYFSKDQKYMVKTITSGELKTLRKMLYKYLKYMQEHYKTSFISRFYGLYSIKQYGMSSMVTVLVMNNLMYQTSSKEHTKYSFSQLYDLKGSEINRSTAGKASKPGKSKVYKDLDLMDTIKLGRDAATDVTNRLERDSKFLAGNNIMDYSLLLAVHICTEKKITKDHLITHCSGLYAKPTAAGQSSTAATSRLQGKRLPEGEACLVCGSREVSAADGMHYCRLGEGAAGLGDESKEEVKEGAEAGAMLDAVDTTLGQGKRVERGDWDECFAADVIKGPGIYHMGIIDVLQEWNWTKKAELWLKRIFRCHWRRKDWEKLSCVPPKLYQERFEQKMKERYFEL